MFERNRNLTAGHLLHVVDKAMSEFTSRPMPNDYEDLHWHFKHLSDVCHLINALEQAVSFLKIAHELPAIKYVTQNTDDEAQAEAA